MPEFATELSVVIPSWNQAELVGTVLANLGNQTKPPGRVIVVDNASEDETGPVAARYGAEHVALASNEGFASAVNAGIQAARTEWLLILNNDVELRPDWIERALAAAQREGADFVSGKLLQARHPERIDGAWDLVSRAGCAWRCAFGAPDGELWNQPRRILFGSLTALLIRRSVFERVGLLDTRYGSYYEDVDFGLRMALAGIPGVYEPEAVATHIGSATLGRGGRSVYLISRNQVLFAAKFRLTRLFPFRVWWGQTLYALAALRQGTGLAAIRGKLDGMRIAAGLNAEPVDERALRRVLEQTEQEILEYQRRVGFDLSWRLYFSA